jgi:hypothetical protein
VEDIMFETYSKAPLLPLGGRRRILTPALSIQWRGRKKKEICR